MKCRWCAENPSLASSALLFQPIIPSTRSRHVFVLHGERNFQAANAPTTNAPSPTQEPEPTPQVPSTAAAGPKRKRGEVITTYENASSQDRIPDSQLPSTSSRPRRNTASGKNLNLAQLSAQSLGKARPVENMEIDSPSTVC